MIPQRIKLRGFLCYKDEQDISFHDRSLWMLAGNNGSGKSTVFDAVTYALFGYHRGGSQHAGDLINKDSNSLAVEFEFLLDGQHYRIRRTLQRNQRGVAGTQLIARRRDGQNGTGRWEPLEDTSRKANFDTWIRDNIGLDYETFTSSVLLLQGKAEKLLDSTAKGRFEVLAGIVDLEHYEKLHRLADEERKAHEGALKSLRERRDGLPDVTTEALEQAAERIEDADKARQQAQADVESCQALIFQARAWADLQTRLAETRQRWTQAESLLAESKTIEEGVKRLQDLRAALPHVQAAIEQRQQLQDSERRTGELSKQKEGLQAQLNQQEHALEQTRRKRTALQQLIQTDEQRRREAAGQYRQAAVLLE
ncbi:MAG TPA: SMC family ATPase, partial [Gemmataceae bacterium]|nr:SMC family ATPase [Gemmataceae bacterium]